MGWKTKRAASGAALAVVAAAVAMTTAPAAVALDPGANASAFGLSANVLSGTVNITPTPTSTYPPGGTHSVVSLNLGALGTVGVLTATTTGNSGAGTSSATGSVANVALLGVLPSVPAISADAVEATCNAAAPAAPTGQTTLTNAKLGGNNVLDLHPAANTKLINLPNLAVVTLNEQTTSGGALTVNAIHIQLGPIVNGVGSLGDVILGSATCGPNAVTAPVDAFSFGSLPVVLIGLALVISLGFGVRAGVRRLGARA